MPSNDVLLGTWFGWVKVHIPEQLHWNKRPLGRNAKEVNQALVAARKSATLVTTRNIGPERRVLAGISKPAAQSVTGPKEFPVSDESEGGLPPNRPGMNAQADVGGGSTVSANEQEKRRRKRRRKPRNRKRSSIQADSTGALERPENGPDESAGASSGHSAGNNPDEGGSDASPFDRKRKSKRARRRRGRKKKMDRALDQHGAADTNLSSGPQPKDKRSRQTRRPGRDQTHNRRRVRPPDEPATVSNGANVADNRARGKGNQNAGQANRRATTGSRQTQHKPLRRRDAYAALDLGTNNCRLLVAVPQQPGRFQVIDAFSRIVRLGEGLAGSGRLGDDAMDRAVEALKACADKLANRTVRGVRLIATEACRRAENGAEFLQRVEVEAGLKLEIVDRETEARLAVAGCSSLVDRKAKGVVLFDIGGGSSELALLDLRKRRKYDLGPALVSWTSLPHGVVTLSEKHGGGRQVTRQVFDNMVDEISELLLGFEGRDELVDAASEGEVHLLGTSGTVTTLAGIHLKLPRYDRRQVDGTWMVSDEVDAMVDALVAMDFEERVKNPCIGHERADLVLAGCAILVAIQKLWPCPRLRVADRGLREGLLTEMMNADNAWQRRPYRPARWKK